MALKSVPAYCSKFAPSSGLEKDLRVSVKKKVGSVSLKPASPPQFPG